MTTPTRKSDKKTTTPKLKSSSESIPDNFSNFSLLSTIDFKAIDEMDPSLADGHVIIFDNEIPIEIRTKDQEANPNDVGTLAAIKVKVLTLGPADNLISVKVELESEQDLFFHYTHTMNKEQYNELQQTQQLMVGFEGYPGVLSKMLNSCIKSPETNLCIFVMEGDGVGVMNFIQNMQYKFVELLSLTFKESDQHIVRQSISFRYNSLRSKLAIMQARMRDVSSLVKLKNPSLLLQIQRGTPEHTKKSLLSPKFTTKREEGENEHL